MFATMNRRASLRAVLAFALALSAAACDSTTEPDEHQEAVGVVITDQNDATLVTINAARQVTGSLTVAAGAARALEVYFVDEDGDRFQLEAGGEHTLAWQVANQAVAQIGMHDGHLDLDGVSAGSTTVVFSLMHGGHADYETPAIPIVVTP